MREFELTDKIVLVTGAGSGIGRAIALSLSRCGATVIATDRDEAAAGETARLAEGERENAAIEAVELDVANEERCRRVAEEVLAQHGRLDVLVNNAGIGHVGTMGNTSGEDFDRIMAINLRGAFNVTKAFFASMLERKSGHIINISSLGGVAPIRDRLAYCTSKFGLVGMTKSIALDHAADGIRCNCVCPGRVATPYVKERAKEYPDPERALREMADPHLIKRMIQPEEVAAAVVYLASDAAAMMTGATLTLDGGWSCGK